MRLAHAVSSRAAHPSLAAKSPDRLVTLGARVRVADDLSQPHPVVIQRLRLNPSRADSISCGSPGSALMVGLADLTQQLADLLRPDRACGVARVEQLAELAAVVCGGIDDRKGAGLAAEGRLRASARRWQLADWSGA